MDSKKLLKVAPKYFCQVCDYNTSKKSSFAKHLATDKHKINENDSKMVENGSKKLLKVAQIYQCECGKAYKYDSGYYRHKKKCEKENNYVCKDISEKPPDKEMIILLIKQNTEFQQMLLEQSKTIIELSKNTSITNNTTNNTNSHNKSFNLNMFLNETCKDAMNINDFVDSLQLQLSDLEKVGEVGYIEGISNIIIKNLNALDVTLRPVHCTDKKRETMYIKDEDKWEKEDVNKVKLHKMVRKVANKNIHLIQDFKEKYPDCITSKSRHSDKYNKIIVESMGGTGDNDFEKEEKIIKKIAKEVFIDKDPA